MVYRQLKSGEKSLEIRVGYSQIKKIRQGDTITFENYGPNEFAVKRVAVYDSFKRIPTTPYSACFSGV